MGINWHFIPAYSHFGALWELGIKATKYLKRIATNAVLTFEEFGTLLAQIDNSGNSEFAPTDSDVIKS